MGTAAAAFQSMIGVCDVVFWDSITYAGRSITAKIDVDTVVDNQQGIYQADALLVLKRSDFPSSPPETGDSVTIPAGTIGAGSYRTGEKIAEDEISHTVVINKI